jgi:hypothetical protein
MTSTSTKDQARVSAATLRDPIVPLDFGAWPRRVSGVIRRGIRGLTLLAAAPALLSVLEQIALEAVRPSMAGLKFRLEAAANATPTGFVDQWTVFRISVVPLLPTMAIFTVLIAITSAFCYGGAYHRALREANGQPISVLAALRAAASRVPAMLGWGALVVVGTFLTFGLLLVPGTLTGNPWLNIFGPVLGFLLAITATVVALPTLCGVVFVDRAGLGRCIRLIKGQFWPTFVRALVTCAGITVYILAMKLVMKLLLAPFGGAQGLSTSGRAIEFAVQGLLALPLFHYLVATTLVSYAELRFREDPATTTRTLAASLQRDQRARATVTNSL